MNMFAAIVPREIVLRDYQIEAEEKIRAKMRAGLRRVLLAAPTAFGKTEVTAHTLRNAVQKGSRVWFIVDRVTLVNQTSKRLARYGIEHGIIQADRPADPDQLVQVVSAQTLARRWFELGDLPDLIIVDEAHCQYRAVLDLIARATTARVIGLTATPFSAGMAQYWDAVVNGATVNYLLSIGFLTPLKVKACVAPDMAGVKQKFDGEYEEEEAGKRGITIIGDVVQTWVAETAKAFGGPVKTIVFSPSVAHGEELCRQFADAGYNFQQISYRTSDKDRDEKIDEFGRPDSAIHGLVSCAVLTKGFDVPDILCGISCRPYRKSFSSHIQEMGRVMRISNGKTFGLWLDHSGNSIAFADDTAWLFEYGVDSLSDAERKDSEVREPTETAKVKHFCGNCGMQVEHHMDACPACGWERPKRGEIRIVEGQLIDFDLSTRETFQPRPGLRAECLKNPRAIWNAALAYCFASSSRKGPEALRKWAFGIWRGIYPGCKLPHGLYDVQPKASAVDPREWSLIDREVARFRKGRKAA